MRALPWILLAGCGFEVHPGGANGADANRGDANIDAIIDTAIDAPSTPVMLTVPCNGDVYLRTTLSPDENTNDRPYVIVDGNTYVAPALFAFDLSAVPGTAQIVTAEIVLTLEGTGGAPMQLHRVLEDWDEATVTSNSRRSVVQNVLWMGPGVTPPSRGTATIGVLDPIGTDVAVSATLDVAVVQSWVSTPATNFGVVLRTEQDDGAQFSSRETNIVARRPFLRLTYVP
jgi:hypothetical protein